MSELYTIFNGPMPTTAGQLPVLTSAVIKTLLQVKLGTGVKGKVVEWGISFDGAAAAVPGVVELIETGTVFATVTAHAASGIHKFGDPNAVDPTTTAFAVGTSATGYTSTSEGSITAVRTFDAKLLPPTGPYEKQFPLGREPVINVATALRIRVTFPVTVNAICYVVIEI